MIEQKAGSLITVKTKQYVMTWDELMMVCAVGNLRHIENIRGPNKRKSSYTKLGPYQAHIEGCCGEYALAQMLGLPWKGKGGFGGVDLGKDIEVRTTAFMGPGLCVTVKEKDPDDARVYLVRGFDGDYEAMGWINAGKAREHDEWIYRKHNNGKTDWWVPVEHLEAP